MSSIKSSLESTSHLLKQTIHDFTQVTQVFNSLTKHTNELESQEFSEKIKESVEKPAFEEFHQLKETYFLSGEGFEVLIFKFMKLLKNSESVSTDIVEIICQIDQFMLNKEETVNKIWDNHVVLIDINCFIE